MHEQPTSEQLADFAIQSATKAKELGHEPRVALLSHTSFGGRSSPVTSEIKRTVEILDSEKRDFSYEGEMTVSVALDPQMTELYPFSRLKGPANVLIMPNLFASAISSRLLQKLGGGTVIGPLLVGLSRPAQIARLDATVSDIVTVAVLAAHDSIK